MLKYLWLLTLTANINGCAAKTPVQERRQLSDLSSRADSDSAGDAHLHGCAPEMIAVPVAAPLTPYCIDAQEVSREAYAAFLASPPAQAPPFCSWNATYEPSRNWPAVPGTESQPVGWVDWCDAYVYCLSVGKRLCGRIGGGPNPHLSTDANAYTNPTASQWFNACSAGGTQQYSFGATYSDCEDAFGSMCEGPWPGLFGMSGGLWEWEDSCVDYQETGAAMVACHLRGGAAATGSDPASNVACAFVDGWLYDSFPYRSFDLLETGIRCCTL